MNGQHKITSGHRARTALVYLRQSTLVQVREHAESTMRQYALADVAVSLGWAPRDVEVIDRDVGGAPVGCQKPAWPVSCIDDHSQP